jgi:diphthamide synthase subunit DPH2
MLKMTTYNDTNARQARAQEIINKVANGQGSEEDARELLNIIKADNEDAAIIAHVNKVLQNNLNSKGSVNDPELTSVRNIAMKALRGNS